MATPTPEKIGIYYASKNLDPQGQPVRRIVGADATAISFPVSNIDEDTGFWNGALGFFTDAAHSALRGQTFHVRSWNKQTETLTLASPLPTAPTQNDKFVLFAGGGAASDTEVLGMKVSGKQPEIEEIKGTNVTGVTIKKVSPLLGEGTLQLNYIAATKTLQIRMGTSGNYGSSVDLSEDMTNLVLYAPDLAAYIIVDVVYSQLNPTTNKTDSFTLTTPKGNMIPNYEGYETNDGVGRTRYHLFAVKNNATDPNHAISGMMLWTGRPEGNATTLSSSYSVSTTAPQAMNVASAANWPTRGFWVKNKTANNGAGDLRYVDYRSGNTLYTKPVIWGRVDFQDGGIEITPGMTITSSHSANAQAIVDQVILTSGSWDDGTAAGTLVLKSWLTNFMFTTNYNILVDGVKAADVAAASTRGYRDHVAVSWSSGHLIEPAADVDLGVDLPDEDGLFKEPATENIVPKNVLFGTYGDQRNNLFAGPIFPGGMLGIWVRQTILDGTQARENINGDLHYEWY